MPSVDHRLLRHLAALPASLRDTLADEFARRAADLGLVYLGADGPRPIPVAFPPVIEPRRHGRSRSLLIRSITAALIQGTARILDEALGSALADEMLAELDPLERPIVEARFHHLERLATVRADLFVDPRGNERILELNATIPAMQGYSDIAAAAFVEAAIHRLRRFGASGPAPAPEEILGQNGSNALDLLHSLVACYRGEGGRSERPSIALVHRPQDSQLYELRYLAARFRNEGYDARTVVVDDLRLGDDDRVEVVTTRASVAPFERRVDVGGSSGDPQPPAIDSRLDGGPLATATFRPDILYRHIFARRVDPASPFGAILRRPDGHALFNPVDPQLEQKSMLAEISVASVDPSRLGRLGLSEDQAALFRTYVPWTRRMRPGPSTDPMGRPIGELIAHVRSRPAAFVLKRSWDFGGKGVFLGAEHDGDPASLARSATRFDVELPWRELVEACASQPGWVLQERVELLRSRLWIAAGAGAAAHEAFVDLSAYANHGVASAPSGGVCRASRSAIVNIQSGGGVVPLLSSEAADALVRALDL